CCRARARGPKRSCLRAGYRPLSRIVPRERGPVFDLAASGIQNAMTETAVELERQFVHDLDQLGERFVDEKFSTELYRALANRIWRRSDLEGHVSLSWGRAEEIVKSLRDRHGHAPLELAQTGGEGDISRTVGGDLERLGWTPTPL